MARRPRAFTLLELLVSIGVIALLIGLVVVSMKGVRSAAARTESSNALRNIMRGYLTYSTDHRQSLLPGFVDEPTLELLRMPVRHGNGTPLYQPGDPVSNSAYCAGGLCDASSYVWRLMPYLDGRWDLLMVDYGSDELNSILTNKELGCPIGGVPPKYGHGTSAVGELGIGTNPAYGLNSIFLGGDSTHADNATRSRNPFDPVNPDDVIAATRVAQVLNPARITVFAPGEQPDESQWNPISLQTVSTLNNDTCSQEQVGRPNEDFGYCELRAPYLSIDGNGAWGNPQWWFDADGEIEETPTSEWDSGGSYPVGRHGPEDIPLSHLDGSVEIVRIYELGLSMEAEQSGASAAAARREAMSRWWPFATGIR